MTPQITQQTLMQNRMNSFNSNNFIRFVSFITITNEFLFIKRLFFSGNTFKIIEIDYFFVNFQILCLLFMLIRPIFTVLTFLLINSCFILLSVIKRDFLNLRIHFSRKLNNFDFLNLRLYLEVSYRFPFQYLGTVYRQILFQNSSISSI